MKITFHGAAREVTGSKHLLEVNGKKIFLDFGMFQGRRSESAEKNADLTGFNPKEIDAVILSHAHIDHSGNLPFLVKNGFKGTIYSTHATRDVCAHMLMDSAYIQEREAEYINKRKNKHGVEPVEPVYNVEDATETMKLFQGMSYDHPCEIAPGVTLSLRDAGHILGSAQAVLIIEDHEDNNKQKILLYTGDLGRKNLPILRDPVQIERADIVITESTYGNRFHRDILDVGDQLAEVVIEACKKGGKIIVPAFAMERTQEIVYHMNALFQSGKIPKIPIYVDSPLAVNLTQIFTSHPECMDRETWETFLNDQKNPFGFGNIEYITSVEDSKALSEKRGPAMIISAAGMCEFGRILHHLKNNIEDPSTTVLIVGYMAEHTLGRKILEKQKIVKIFGEPYKLNAKVVVMDAFSAHSDRSDLLDYLAHIDGLKDIFLVHGEESQGLMFQDILREEGYKNVNVPHRGQTFEI
ncbi:MBL fold metallo-hydrolase [Candidatus Peregrinibacteria bacterium CG11_big_fil_rev_8_21_14_0_20_46_8]|nr:MAG: MBL fold metallo-hydrolase [Candidatus Peregrinibacteria bacterium CG11_big_fil_rev_8_21_14_0_20_46_8]